MVLDGCFYWYISKQVPKLTVRKIFFRAFAAKNIFMRYFFLIFPLEFFVFMFLMLTLQLEKNNNWT